MEKVFSSGCSNVLEWWWGKYLSSYCYYIHIHVAGTGSRKNLPALLSGCQQWMLTVTFKSLTVSRFWRWRECTFRASAVTWKEAAKALLTLTAHDTWVRGSMTQKRVAGPGLSGLAEGGHRKQVLWVSMWSHLCAMNVRGEGEGSFFGHWKQVSRSTRTEVRYSWFGVFSPKPGVREGALHPASYLCASRSSFPMLPDCNPWMSAAWEDAM